MAGLWSDAKFTVDNVPINEFGTTPHEIKDSTLTLDVDEGADNTKKHLKKETEERAEELMPPFYKTQGGIDKETLEWDKKHREAKRQIRETDEYKFAMLVAGASGQRLDRIWMSPSEEPRNNNRGPINESGDSFLTAAPESDAYSRMQQFQHKWAMVPEISLEINLSPSTYFHLEEAIAALNRERGCENITASNIIKQSRQAMLLARLVALGINLSNFMGGMNYQLDSNYMRLKKEQRIAIWRLAASCRKGGI